MLIGNNSTEWQKGNTTKPEVFSLQMSEWSYRMLNKKKKTSDPRNFCVVTNWKESSIPTITEVLMKATQALQKVLYND